MPLVVASDWAITRQRSPTFRLTPLTVCSPASMIWLVATATHGTFTAMPALTPNRRSVATEVISMFLRHAPVHQTLHPLRHVLRILPALCDVPQELCCCAGLPGRHSSQISARLEGVPQLARGRLLFAQAGIGSQVSTGADDGAGGTR